MPSFSTRDQCGELWNDYKIRKELASRRPVQPCRGADAAAWREYSSNSWGEGYLAAGQAAHDRRVALGLEPRFRVAVPPLPASELWRRNGADVAGAGWALFQVACSDAFGRFSARMLEATGRLPNSAGPCDHKGGPIPASRASLEGLPALPQGEYAKLDGAEREYEAAGALWYRLKEEGRRLQEEGELCAAEETLERAERAEAAYKSLGEDAYQQLLDVVCRAGWAGKYYADRLRRLDAAIAKMETSSDELFDEGKHEAVLEILARVEQLEAQHLSLITELYDGMGYPESLSEKDREAGVPYGTTFRLETTLAATVAASPPRRRKDGSVKEDQIHCDKDDLPHGAAEVRQLAKLVARLKRVTEGKVTYTRCRSDLHPWERAAIAEVLGELEVWIEGAHMTRALLRAGDEEANGIITLVTTLTESEDTVIVPHARDVLLRWERRRDELPSLRNFRKNIGFA